MPRCQSVLCDAEAKAVRANMKNDEDGSGTYFPILAANQFTPDGKFVNGVYVPHVAALQFEGPYEWKKVCNPGHHVLPPDASV